MHWSFSDEGASMYIDMTRVSRFQMGCIHVPWWELLRASTATSSVRNIMIAAGCSHSSSTTMLKHPLLSSHFIMVCAEARAAAVPEAVSLPAAKVPPTDFGCQHQLLYHSQAEHLPGKWTILLLCLLLHDSFRLMILS